MENQKPLSGLSVLITRDEKQARPFAEKIRLAGGNPVSIPLIGFEAVDFAPAEGTYDWIVFTSANAVHYFGLSEEILSGLGSPEIAAIGSKTREAIEERGLRAAFMPREYEAEAFSREFLTVLKAPGRILIPKGNLAGSTICRMLEEQGQKCTELIVYKNEIPPGAEGRLLSFLKQGQIDIIALTSSSTAVNLMKTAVKYDLLDVVQKSLVAAIGPATKAKAESLGLEVKVCPDTYTADAMLEAIIKYLAGAG
ncbi:uroporphyrinogen-III synthase [Peribacillus sp. SCS-37]|uniref:uroporphyrinogen-III synthase n=1 Tax=Paraperibacillus esterisolvens TaxID=3115296 RepID=UPI003906C85A